MEGQSWAGITWQATGQPTTVLKTTYFSQNGSDSDDCVNLEKGGSGFGSQEQVQPSAHCRKAQPPFEGATAQAQQHTLPLEALQTVRIKHAIQITA